MVGFNGVSAGLPAGANMQTLATGTEFNSGVNDNFTMTITFYALKISNNGYSDTGWQECKTQHAACLVRDLVLRSILLFLGPSQDVGKWPVYSMCQLHSLAPYDTVGKQGVKGAVPPN